jgi:hypothetical protein
MGKRHLNQFASSIVVAAGLAGSLIACSKEEARPASPASVSRTEVFRFAPPDGTEFTRTDRRTQELAIVGAPLRRVDNEELTWRTRVNREGDEYRVHQDLVYLSLTRDGQILAEGKVPEGISATLVIDDQGNLTAVKGLERTAEILRSLAPPDKEAEAEQVITPQALANLVAARYRVLFGETIGRPAAPGSSWKISNPPGSFVASRTVTVVGHEACGTASCARMQVEFKLDPKVVADTALSLVQSRVREAGGDPSKVSVRNATYAMSGWMLVEPATMLSHGASLTEGGTVTLAAPDQPEVTVQMNGKTELSYSYGEARTSERPSQTEHRAASAQHQR